MLKHVYLTRLRNSRSCTYGILVMTAYRTLARRKIFSTCSSRGCFSNHERMAFKSLSASNFSKPNLAFRCQRYYSTSAMFQASPKPGLCNVVTTPWQASEIGERSTKRPCQTSVSPTKTAIGFVEKWLLRNQICLF